MPNFNRWAGQYALLTRYHGVTHPSLPNYLALIGGDFFGIQDNCTDCTVDGPSLPALLQASGRTWKAYLEGLPEPGRFIGASSGRYRKKHNPFVYFSGLLKDPDRLKQNTVPLDALRSDLEKGPLPDFAFIVPDMCNSSHDCTLDVTDAWLGKTDEATAIRQLNEWGGQPLPLSASALLDGTLRIRLSSAGSAVDAAHARLGGKVVEDAERWWADLREQRLPFFAGEGPIWHVSVPPTTPPLRLEPTLLEWHGGQRWVRGDHAPEAMHPMARALGGHATRFRGAGHAPAFQPLDPALARINARLKAEFDPAGIFNPGRLIPTPARGE